jgi:beta-glucanase (GH16 family)
MKPPFLNLMFKFAVIAFFCSSISAAYLPDGKLTFSDEFNKKNGTPADSKKWTAEIGGRGWGNQELQYYTADAENAYHDGAGSLVIKAIKKDLPPSFDCWYGQCKYTSARLITKGKFDQKYGRFEARIKIPRGQGMWSAFWMLGNNIDTVGWANCGEIDVMENIGREPSTVHGTIHGPGYSSKDGIGAAFTLANNKKICRRFSRIRDRVDGK